MRILIDGQTLATPESNRGIGVYFKNIVKSMVMNDAICEWYITIPKIELLDQLDVWVKNKINPVVNESIDLSSDDNYSDMINKVIHDYRIDVYWNPNVLMNNVLFPSKKLSCDTVFTIYDLIPMVFENQYINKWPQHVAEQYKYRIEKLSEVCDGLIFISKATQNDYHKYVNNEYNAREAVLYLGIENDFRPNLTNNNSSSTPFILYTGGFDFRKNMSNALHAFAKLIKSEKINSLYKDLKFIVVCAYSEESKLEYEKLADSLGVSDRLLLTGYIPDKKLRLLYRNCKLFFFPSLYEGFGIPVLEAMVSGVPVVASNISSIPEIGQDYIRYCNPNEVSDMAKVMEQTIIEAANDKKMTVEQVKHARQFTWESAGNNTIEFFEDVFHKESCINIMNYAKKKIAYVSPLPPQKTGIANYSAILLPQLAKYFNIDVFVDNVDKCSINKDIEGIDKIYELSLLERYHNNYDTVLYHLGNNSKYHKKIYKVAWNIPGIVEFHDFNIHPFMQHAFLLEGDCDMYKSALVEGYGEEGLNHYKDIYEKRADCDIWKYPMGHAIVKRSKAAIVHSQWARKQFPSSFNVFPIPLSAGYKCNGINIDIILQFRKKHSITESEYIIGCFGFVNTNKRPEKVIQALFNLRQKGYPVKLFFFGELCDNTIWLYDLIKNLQLEDAVKFTGFLEQLDYYCALNVTDIVVNLRFPTMGESSATLCEALTCGKPTIVSNVNQYCEMPDDVCWKVDVGNIEIDLLAAYLEELLKEKRVREKLGSNGQRYADNALSIEKIAREYYNVINSVAK